LVLAIKEHAENPTAENAAKVAIAAAGVVKACKAVGGSPPDDDDEDSDPPPPYDHSPSSPDWAWPQRGPVPVLTPAAQMTEIQSSPGAHCNAVIQVSVPYSTSTQAVYVDWGDGQIGQVLVAPGEIVTLSHNYFYSTSPFPRLYADPNTRPLGDGDPEGDGSIFHIVQAHVSGTAGRVSSGYGVVEHLGPFYGYRGSSYDPDMDVTTS
jgi:hypothetical protein